MPLQKNQRLPYANSHPNDRRHQRNTFPPAPPARSTNQPPRYPARRAFCAGTPLKHSLCSSFSQPLGFPVVLRSSIPVEVLASRGLRARSLKARSLPTLYTDRLAASICMSIPSESLFRPLAIHTSRMQRLLCRHTTRAPFPHNSPAR